MLKHPQTLCYHGNDMAECLQCIYATWYNLALKDASLLVRMSSKVPSKDKRMALSEHIMKLKMPGGK